MSFKPWRVGGRKPKLTPEQVEALRQWAANRQTLAEKAAEIGISVSAAKNYISGVHVKRTEEYRKETTA